MTLFSKLHYFAKVVGVLALHALCGAAGAAAAFGIAFYVAYACCRAVAWIAGNDDYMFLMWLFMPVGFGAVIGGFAGGVLLCGILLPKHWVGSWRKLILPRP